MSDAAARLSALRAKLKTLALDGFLVPMADEYQNEYVPASSKRIEFLTGFAGSAGLLVVLPEKTLFFTDSRYTLAAEQQLDAAIFSIFDTEKTTPQDWIKANVKEATNIGFDPWLHSAAGFERWTKAVEETSAALTPVLANPVDAIWNDRPAAPATKVIAHPIQYTGEGSADKRKRLAKELKDKKITAAVITSPPSIAWLLNVRATDVPHNPLALSYAVLFDDGRVDWFIDTKRVDQTVVAAIGEGLTIKYPETFRQELRDLGARKVKVRIDKQSCPAAVQTILKEAGAALDAGDDPCALPMGVKNEVELNGMRAAHKRDAVAMVRFLSWLEGALQKEKHDELSLEEKLKAFRARDPLFRDTSFDAIIGSGPNGAIVHYRATKETNRPIETNTLLLIDSGAQYPDGTTDITRTLAIGTPTAEMRDRFTRVLKGHISLASVRFPAGTRGSDLDSFARRALWDAGLDYRHGTGHGVGSYLCVHEGPHGISRRSDRVAFKPGMVVTNEPGYYKTHAYGIRIENMMIVSELITHPDSEFGVMAFEALTLVPIDQRAINADMLTSAEKAWLNDYHARVQEEISPLVEPDVKMWLQIATRPLI